MEVISFSRRCSYTTELGNPTIKKRGKWIHVKNLFAECGESESVQIVTRKALHNLKGNLIQFCLFIFNLPNGRITFVKETSGITCVSNIANEVKIISSVVTFAECNCLL